MLFSKNEIEEIFKIVSPITISVRDVDGSNSPLPLKMCKKRENKIAFVWVSFFQ